MSHAEEWVLLAYRLPREPSTPRSAVWRKLKRLGVAQLSDGLVALPADTRTREQFDWIAEDITDYGGEAAVWIARPADISAEEVIVGRMSGAIAAEYDAVAAEAETMLASGAATRARGAARLRRELHRIQARDYFQTPSRDHARRAVEELSAASTAEARS
jgi:hypothetical protein